MTITATHPARGKLSEERLNAAVARYAVQKLVVALHGPEERPEEVESMQRTISMLAASGQLEEFTARLSEIGR